ncbi:MAG: hypothetical protein AAFT19_07795 [Pseudomonadota bacterium]
MRRTFVIFYTAREGSSAIIHQLSGQRDIVVPVFEGLDRYAFRRHFAADDLIHAVDLALAKGEFAADSGAEARMLAQRHPEQSVDTVDCIGFKWRPHGDPAQMTEVFKRNNTTVFLLFRRDFAELVASLIVSAHIKKSGNGGRITHHQFWYRNAPSQERDRMRQHAESVRIALNRSEILQTAVKRVALAFRIRRYAERVARGGVPMHVIYYEDFLRDPVSFLQGVKTTLALEQPFERARGKEFEKMTTMPATERIIQFEEFLSTAPMRVLARAYAGQLARAERLASGERGSAVDAAFASALKRPN